MKEGPTVYLDGWNPTKTVLVEEPSDGITAKFAAEYFFSYDIGTNGLIVNATHVTFPKHRLIKSAFYRSMKIMGSDHENHIQPMYEVGIGHHKFFNHNPKSEKNPMGGSMFSTDTKVGVAERLLGLELGFDRKQSASFKKAPPLKSETMSKKAPSLEADLSLDYDPDESTMTFLARKKSASYLAALRKKDRHVAGCSTETGGTCAAFRCHASRNATCSESRCVCQDGSCAVNGACVNSKSADLHTMFKLEDTLSKSEFEATLPFGADNGDADEMYRTFLTGAAGGLAKPGPQTIQALGLPNKNITDFVQLDNGAPPTELLKRADIVRKEMQAKLAGLSERLRDPGPIEPKLQTTNCFHWDATDTDTISFDDDTISFALNTKMNSFRGETVSAPWSEFAAMQGTTVWTHRGNKIEIYYAVAIRGALGDPLDHAAAEPGLVMYSAPDGIGPKPVEIKPNQTAIKGFKNWKGYIIYKLVTKQIDDYNGLWDKTRCTDERKQYLRNLYTLKGLDSAVRHTMMQFYGQGTGRTKPETIKFGMYMSGIATCWLDLIQPAPAYKGYAQYGLFMANVLGHVVLEYPVMDQWDDLGSTDWNVCSKNDLMVNGAVSVKYDFDLY
jgi:hypothetical protein